MATAPERCWTLITRHGSLHSSARWPSPRHHSVVSVREVVACLLSGRCGPGADASVFHRQAVLTSPTAAFHSDVQLVAEPRGAVVRGADREVASPRDPSFDQRPRGVHPHMDPTLERRTQTVRLAQDPRRDPGEPRCILRANLRLRTLGVERDEDGLCQLDLLVHVIPGRLSLSSPAFGPDLRLDLVDIVLCRTPRFLYVFTTRTGPCRHTVP
jgi:hypothetical protein